MAMEKIPGLPTGWGEDLSQHRRPGVPMEARSPDDLPFDAPMVRARTSSSRLPPRGLSGMMRKAAYRYPEHFAQRWLILLMADRVDVLEHQAKRHWPIVAGVGGLGLLALVGARRRKAKKLAAIGATRDGKAMEYSGAPITGGEPATTRVESSDSRAEIPEGPTC